jgi:hypothetical protein
MTGSTAGPRGSGNAAGPKGPALQGEPIERDAELGAALHDAAGGQANGVDWMRLRRAINDGAADELARRRRSQRARVFAVPATIAAGFALFVLVARAPEQGLTPSFQSSAAGQRSIEELLDADVSDGQFRALVSGADEANELLAIAAEEVR